MTKLSEVSDLKSKWFLPTNISGLRQGLIQTKETFTQEWLILRYAAVRLLHI